jgi:hypothetical protein
MREDHFSFTVTQHDGPTVTVYDAPRPENRLEEGVRKLFARIRVERKSIAWSELRQAARDCGLFVDPRDDAPPEPDRYAGISQFIHYDGR